MRKIIALSVVLALALAMAQADTPYHDDMDYAGFAGRLTIPDVGVDVALYRSMAQAVVDRKDSAAIFAMHGAQVIGDHKNQAFRGLKDVEAGMLAYIHPPDGDVITLRCVAVLDGRNTGQTITDKEGRIVIGDAPYLMYTCKHGWRNIMVCQWEVVH